MKNKSVKTRKPHVCEICDREIPVGSEAMFYSYRAPLFEIHDDPDKEGPQIGIQFFRGYHCLNDCDKPEPCQKGEHNFQTVTLNEQGDEDEFCDQCFRMRDELPADGVFNYNTLK